ncbi:MAG: Fic family protein [Armatimonadetes bacterium]|nr:Fic family protein [Armatimonadota bacterium]
MRPAVPDTLPLTDLDWKPLIRLMGQANRALSTYNGVLYGIPNPGVLLSPLTTQEAVLSSRIEGTLATLGEVLQYEAGQAPAEESRRLDIQEIMNYRTAMVAAEHELERRPFCLNLLKQLHGILLAGVRGQDKARGRFRSMQNWIGRPGSPIEKADFVPPDPLHLMKHLDNWEKYYHHDEEDPIVQLAVLHAQFEIIHPFMDGNGRLGRMIIPLFLHEKGLLSHPTFYMSAYFEEHRDVYVDHLRGLTTEAGAWNRWVAFFLTALTEQARVNSQKARQIIELYDRLKEEVIEATHSQYAVPLLDYFFAQPVLQSSSLDNRPNLPGKGTKHALLTKLVNAKILKVGREAAGRRSQILVLPSLINLCEGKEVF